LRHNHRTGKNTGLPAERDNTMHRLSRTLLLLFPLTVWAGDPPLEKPPATPVPEALPPPPVSSGIDEEGTLEPEVKIIKRKESTIYEYRVNNQLYMVKVVPSIGFPYYLIDTDGDGSLESRYNKLEPNLVVPTWMIYRW
jgi:hypothetical protein